VRHQADTLAAQPLETFCGKNVESRYHMLLHECGLKSIPWKYKHS
jgi:hypothetical protein